MRWTTKLVREPGRLRRQTERGLNVDWDIERLDRRQRPEAILDFGLDGGELGFASGRTSRTSCPGPSLAIECVDEGQSRPLLESERIALWTLGMRGRQCRFPVSTSDSLPPSSAQGRANDKEAHFYK